MLTAYNTLSSFYLGTPESALCPFALSYTGLRNPCLKGIFNFLSVCSQYRWWASWSLAAVSLSPGANWVQDLEPRGKLFPRPRWQDFVLVYFLAYSLRKQYNIFLTFHRLSMHTSDLSSFSVVLNSYIFSPVTAGLHVLHGKGELTAGGAGYTLWRLLWIKHQAHDHLQWWQHGLDDCSDLSYFCVFTISQFDLFVCHHYWAILSIFCSGPGSHWWCFSVLLLFSLYGGTWPSPGVSPSSDHDYLCLLLSHCDAASSPL